MILWSIQKVLIQKFIKLIKKDIYGSKYYFATKKAVQIYKDIINNTISIADEGK